MANRRSPSRCTSSHLLNTHQRCQGKIILFDQSVVHIVISRADHLLAGSLAYLFFTRALLSTVPNSCHLHSCLSWAPLLTTRWLKQVNNLLENLDDQVGDAVEQAEERLEEAAYEYSTATGGSSAGGSAPTSSGLGAGLAGVGDLSSGARAAAAVSTFAGAVASPGVRGLASKSSVNDILARRGLLGDDDEEEDGDEGEAAMGGDIADRGNEFGAQQSPAAAPLSGMSSVTQEQTAPPAALATGLEPPSSSTEEDESSPTAADAGAISSDPSGWEDDGNDFADLDNADDDGRGGDTTDDGGFSSAVVVDSTDDGEEDSSELDPSSTAPAVGAKAAPPSIDLAAAAVSKAVESAEARARVKEMEAQMFHQANEAKRAAQQAQEAEKELRKLRRHVVKLNSELEAAESEVDAQRTELERAAERMERDRTRNKEEKERVARERKEEREAAAAEHKAALDAMAARHAERIADMEEQVRRANEAREQEGGDWNKELEDALERERDVVKKMMELEEEKETLTNQVSTLQTQMAALETRLGSVTELSETATEREREADDRLDAALSLHARQLSQRQAREAELERTVAELGAALAVARQMEQARGIGGPSGIGATGTASGDGESQNSSLRAQLETAEEEIETLKTQLMLEQQRVSFVFLLVLTCAFVISNFIQTHIFMPFMTSTHEYSARPSNKSCRKLPKNGQRRLLQFKQNKSSTIVKLRT